MTCVSLISRRRILLSGACASISAATSASFAGLPRPVVVELFTSQGCSSCPPADAFFSELRSRPNVIALSYHVDYWDYLGWKDTLGSAEYSQRQYDYAHVRGDMDVYTPQVIVDGRDHFVGSNRNVVLDAIRKAETVPLNVLLTLKDKGKELVVDIGSADSARESMIWLVPISPQVNVRILKGEIAGKEMAYHNVVRGLVPAGMWSGEAKTLTLPKDGVLRSGSEACVALLQQGKTGPILGAAQWAKADA